MNDKIIRLWQFGVKTGVFQPEILINHLGNHSYGFMALVEHKNQNSSTKLHNLGTTIKWQSIIQNCNLRVST